MKSRDDDKLTNAEVSKILLSEDVNSRHTTIGIDRTRRKMKFKRRRDEIERDAANALI